MSELLMEGAGEFASVQAPQWDSSQGWKGWLQEKPITFHQFCGMFDVLAHKLKQKLGIVQQAVLLYLKWSKMCWLWEILAK